MSKAKVVGAGNAGNTSQLLEAQEYGDQGRVTEPRVTCSGSQWGGQACFQTSGSRNGEEGTEEKHGAETAD